MNKLIVIGNDCVISEKAILGMKVESSSELNVWLSDGSVIGIITKIDANDVLKELFKFFMDEKAVVYEIEDSKLWDGEEDDDICL